MTILVTGATGFIGSQLCRALVSAGYPVRAFHRSNSPQLGLEDLVVDHTVGDITQPETLVPAMAGVETVFHTAAKLGPPRHPAEFYAVTVGGTRNVLAAARRAGVRRVIHTSSVAALGVPLRAPGSKDRMLLDEYHTFNVRPDHWRYGHAKYLAELAVQRAVALGLDVVIVNPAVVVGPGDLNRISGNVILRVAHGQLPISAPGGLNVVHIADVVRGHLAAWERGRTGERYILGGENISHRHFLNLIAETAGARPPLLDLPTGLLYSLAHPIRMIERWLPLPISGETLYRSGYFFYYNTARARMELGLPESRPIEQAVDEALTWYSRRGFSG